MEEELTYQIILASFIMPLLLAFFLIWFIWKFQRQKFKHELSRRDQVLKQQALLIEKQEAVEYERNRIASEMHDDLGSGLTSIKYLSDQAIRHAENTDSKDKIHRISSHANHLIHNMSEIIWAMNSRFDTATDLVGYIRRYASEYLDEYGKTLRFNSSGITQAFQVTGEKRRNLFLVTKEILHNFIKHGGVNELTMDVSIIDAKLVIRFQEAGNTSFEKEQTESGRNGLVNMEKRMKEIGGTIERKVTKYGLITLVTYADIANEE